MKTLNEEILRIKTIMGVITEEVTPEQVHQAADKVGMEWDKQVTRDVGDKEPNDDIKKDVKRIISFLTPGEGDEIEGKYMDNIYPGMALQTAQILYDKL